MGLTFSEGFSGLSRDKCLYIGYKSTDIILDKPKRQDRDNEIAKMVQLIPKGRYTHPQMHKELIKAANTVGYRGSLGPGLLWVLIRNMHKFGIFWENNIFEIANEKS
jgi:hypothetical protein